MTAEERALAELLAAADARQSAGDSAAALALYEQALPQLAGADRARVLFHAAQLSRYEGRREQALAFYAELLTLAASLADHRAHGLGLAMRGQLIFLGGQREMGIRDMICGLEELRSCHAAEAEHLTCHTRYFSRRMKRADFERCVMKATTDPALRNVLLAGEGCS